MNSSPFRALVLLLGAGSALGLGHIEPAKAGDAPTEVVSYRDLDMSQPQDVQRLYSRLKKAAADVCHPEPSIGELVRHAVWQQCYSQALEGAVAKVNAPQLLALHRHATGTQG
jgi:UrcA family protein